MEAVVRPDEVETLAQLAGLGPSVVNNRGRLCFPVRFSREGSFMKTRATAGSPIGNSGSIINTKREQMFAVTLFHMRSAPLFRLTERAASQTQAIANAERTYGRIVTAIIGSSDLRDEERYLIHDADLTQVQRGARASQGWRLQYFVRFAGRMGAGLIGDRLSRSEAETLLEEVISADHGLLNALTSGAMIEFCPYQDWARSTGWVTIDCVFRATDITGQKRDMRPISSAMREATRLIVLDVLSSDRETVHVPLPHRVALGRLVIQSATLRAGRLREGLRVPTKLVDWLKRRGHNDVANAVWDAVQ